MKSHFRLIPVAICNVNFTVYCLENGDTKAIPVSVLPPYVLTHFLWCGCGRKGKANGKKETQCVIITWA